MGVVFGVSIMNFNQVQIKRYKNDKNGRHDGATPPQLLMNLLQKTLVYSAVSRKVVGKKAHATIPKGIVGSFIKVYSSFQGNLRKWQETPWTYVCEC